MPALIDQTVPHIRRKLCARFACVSFNPFQTVLAYDTPHIISSLPFIVFIIPDF